MADGRILFLFQNIEETMPFNAGSKEVTYRQRKCIENCVTSI